MIGFGIKIDDIIGKQKEHSRNINLKAHYLKAANNSQGVTETTLH